MRFAQILHNKTHWIFEADEKPQFADDIVIVDITKQSEVKEGWDYDEASKTFSEPTVGEEIPVEQSPLEKLSSDVQEIKTHILTAAEKYDSLDKEESTLNILKTARINKLKEECSNAIYGGFTSGENEFGFNEQDQANFTQQLLLIVSGQTSDVQWKTKNAGVQTFTVEEFQQIISDASAHKLVQQNKYWDKEVLILLAETNEEVDSVIWE